MLYLLDRPDFLELRWRLPFNIMYCLILGVLVKYNKTVTVITEEGQKWNVSPHLLEKVKESKQKFKTLDNVIEINPKG
jgi:hypothetical protein